MPDYSTSTTPLGVLEPDALHRLADGKILLIPRDLPDGAALVEKGKLPDQFDQPLRTAKRVQQAVLAGDFAGTGCGEVFKMSAGVGEFAGEEPVVLLPAGRQGEQRLDFGRRVVELLPLGPELFRGASGGVFALVLIEGEQHGRVGVKVWDLRDLLIA